MAKRKLIYVGYTRNNKLEIVRPICEPTEKEYGEKFFAFIGPFITVRAANFMVKYGLNNPHIQTVYDAERLSKNEKK